ncbi:MAG: hypothetical protein ACLQVL_23225 [Terriglobia bacterium]
MTRRPVSKMQVLEVRHPGLREKVHRMFEEFWPAQDIRQMLQTQYGERLSLRTVARYKSQHWQAQRERVQQIGSSIHRVIGPFEEQRHDQSTIC